MNAVDTLFSWCRMPDVADARVYLVGAAAIFDEYPSQVGQTLADPRTGTRLLKPFPSLFDIREACDAAYEPIGRQVARDRAAASHQLALAAPGKPGQRRRDEQVIDYETRIQPLLEGTLNRALGGHVFVPTPSDGNHAARVTADLEQRRLRKREPDSTGPPHESSTA